MKDKKTILDNGGYRENNALNKDKIIYNLDLLNKYHDISEALKYATISRDSLIKHKNLVNLIKSGDEEAIAYLIETGRCSKEKIAICREVAEHYDGQIIAGTYNKIKKEKDEQELLRAAVECKRSLIGIKNNTTHYHVKIIDILEKKHGIQLIKNDGYYLTFKRKPVEGPSTTTETQTKIIKSIERILSILDK